MNMKKYISILMVLCSLTWIIAFAHPGRTDSTGGHWVRTEGWGYEVGTYHYHNDGTNENTYTPPAITPQPPTSESPLVNSEAETKEYDIEEAIRKAKERKKAEEKNKEESEEENTELEEYKKQAKKREAELKKDIERLKKENKFLTIAFWIMIVFLVFFLYLP
jgi:hypothetical protein